MVRSERLRPAQWAGVVLAFVAIVFARGKLYGERFAGRCCVDVARHLLALIAGAPWGIDHGGHRTTGLTKVSAEKLLSIRWQ